MSAYVPQPYNEKLDKPVSYASQTLTSPEQSQARTNLGLATVASSGSATDLTTGTLPDARLSPKVKSLADLATPALTVPLAMNSSGQVVRPTSLALTRLAMPSDPVVTLNPVAGNLNGTYTYCVSFVTADGETGNDIATVGDYPVNQQISLTNIPIGPAGTIARKIYRGKSSSYDLNLLTTINDNTTTTFNDNVPDATVAAAQKLPKNNTTGGNLLVNGELNYMATEVAVLIGPNVAPNNSGVYSVYIGGDCAKNNHFGYWNVFIGFRAGEENTTGYEVVNIGYRSGGQNTGGHYNTNIGVYAAENNQVGSERTNVGYSAGLSGLSSSATNLGAFAGSAIVTGQHTTTLGTRAASFLADGVTGLTSADSCTYLGAETKAGANNVEREIVIGAYAIGRGTNTCTIGATSQQSCHVNGAAVVYFDCSDPVSPLVQLRTYGNTVSRGKGVGFLFSGQPTDSNSILPLARVYGVFDGSQGVNSERFTIQTMFNGDYADTLTAKRKRIGIGTTNPGFTLDIVDGLVGGINPLLTISSDGTTASRGNYVAQMFRSQMTDSNSVLPCGRLYAGFTGASPDTAVFTMQALNNLGELADRLTVRHSGVLLFVDGSMKLVSVGASDSGGTGFKVLRVPN